MQTYAVIHDYVSMWLWLTNGDGGVEYTRMKIKLMYSLFVRECERVCVGVKQTTAHI